MNKDYSSNRDRTVTPIKKSNKIIGLSYEENNTTKRQESNSLGIDVALPTPTRKIEIQPEKRNIGTIPRRVGRPPAGAYRTANPSRVSVGEMKNPSEF